MKKLLVLAIVLFAAAPAYAAFCELSWGTATAVSQARVGSGGGAYDNQLVVFGGYDNTGTGALDDTWVYDPATDAWTAKATMPAKTVDLGYCVAPEGYAYAVGGSTDSVAYTDEVQEYDIDADTWTTLTNPFPHVCWGPLCAAPGDGYVYCFGGTEDGSTAITDAEKYQIGSDGAWTAISPLPVGKVFGAAVVLDGKIYLTGGWSADDVTYVYDPNTDSYTTLDNLNYGRQRPSLIAAGGQLWLAGGADTWTPVDTDEYFDLTSWTETGTTIGTPVLGATAGYLTGYGIYFAGGRDGSLADRSENQVWQVCIPEFESVTPDSGAAGTSITIAGYTFEENVVPTLFDATKAEYPLENIVVVDDATITADIPATLADGSYGLMFDGTLGQHTEFPDVFEVTSVDDDTTDDDVTDDDVTDDDADDDDDAAGDDDDDDSGCGC